MYEWIKAFHVIAIISWMAGMLYLPRLFVYHCEAEIGSKQSETFKVMERLVSRKAGARDCDVRHSRLFRPPGQGLCCRPKYQESEILSNYQRGSYDSDGRYRYSRHRQTVTGLQ